MSKILVLGGTRFFGKRLVENLLQDGIHDVTVATRGNMPLDFISPVNHLKLDRSDDASLRHVASTGEWDIVYDNICYSPNEALAAVDAFDGRVGKYILTSTLSVHNLGERIQESEFNPYTFPLEWGGSSDFTYGKGKRLAEATLFQRAKFPVIAMRIPFVLGLDDYTKRIQFHIDRILQGTPIGIPNLDSKISFISSEETAKFLQWLGLSDVTGPIHASSKGTCTPRELIGRIEIETGMTAKVLEQTDEQNMSPYGVSNSWSMDTSKASEAGFVFQYVMDWLPDLIQELVYRQQEALTND